MNESNNPMRDLFLKHSPLGKLLSSFSGGYNNLVQGTSDLMSNQLDNNLLGLENTRAKPPTAEEIAHYGQFKPGYSGKVNTAIDPVSGQVVPLKENQQSQLSKEIQITPEQLQQLSPQDSALLAETQRQGIMKDLFARGAMRGSIDSANAQGYDDIVNANNQAKIDAAHLHSIDGKWHEAPELQYTPVQIPQEFLQAQQVANTFKSSPVQNMNLYGTNGNLANTNNIAMNGPGSVNGKAVSNGMQIAGMFDSLGTQAQRKAKSNAAYKLSAYGN